MHFAIARRGVWVCVLPVVSLLALASSELQAQNAPGQPATGANVSAGGRRREGDPMADRNHMFQVLGITLPKLPPEATDPNRPTNTTRIRNSENWDDGVRGHTVLRSEWGTWANYDELKALQAMGPLPDPLTLKNGEKVTDAATWWSQRRPEIVRDFENEIYGRPPTNMPRVIWRLASAATNGTNHTITKRAVGRVDNSSYTNISVSIRLTYTIPAEAKGPVPVIFQFGSGPSGQGGAGSGSDTDQELLKRGWGYGYYDHESLQPRDGAGLTNGIIGLVNKGQLRKPEDMGTLRAWAWGFDRVIDFLETDRQVDAKKLGLEGHSYLGKAAVVCLAFDQRLAIAYASCAGEGGTKLHRHNVGEMPANTAREHDYPEVCGNFLKYVTDPDKMPVDAHELIALCAPRPVFVTGGTWDLWFDPVGEFLSCVYAGPVYKLLGKEDLGTTEMPKPDVALISGDIGYREHTGGHRDDLDWPTFIQYCEKYWGTNAAARLP